MTPPCFTWPRSCKIVVRELVLRGSAPGGLGRGDRPADYRRDLVGREVPQARQRAQEPVPMQDGRPGKRDAVGPPHKPPQQVPPLAGGQAQGQLPRVPLVRHCGASAVGGFSSGDRICGICGQCSRHAIPPRYQIQWHESNFANEEEMRKVAIVEGFRTPFCREGTHFQDLEADFLGALIVREILNRFEKWNLPPTVVDRVIGSNIATPPHAPNIARVMAVKGGLPVSIPADTLGKNCGSGVTAVHYGRLWIESGSADTILVVGAESMSRIPFLYQPVVTQSFKDLVAAKTPLAKLPPILKLYSQLFRFWHRDYQPLIGLKLGLTDPTCDLIMGMTAENLAKDPGFGITRHDQDTFALRSHQNASKAQEKIFKEEITPVFVPTQNGYTFVDADNGIRRNQTIDALGKLKPFFDKRHGTVTIGNSSQITDGAASILLMVEEKAKSLGLPILGYVGDYEDIGFDPRWMGLSPVGAIAKVLQKTTLSLSDFSVIELNEAFSAIVLACVRTMGSDELMQKWFGSYGFGKALGEVDDAALNPHGGAIALGHPVGVSGMRLIITTLREMTRREAKRGLVSACIGGGQGVAMIVERE
ncbi:MAG: thiolase family protein [candidate division NC10 bacterium]|nr:thiolase family protein [candidate division NC10 bacterium]